MTLYKTKTHIADLRMPPKDYLFIITKMLRRLPNSKCVYKKQT